MLRPYLIASLGDPMQRLFSFLLLAFVLTACGAGRADSQSAFTSDGERKPKVAIMPFLNETDIELPARAHELMDEELAAKLTKARTLYAAPAFGNKLSEAAKNNIDLMNLPPDDLRQYTRAEYVILSGLCDYATRPVDTRQNYQEAMDYIIDLGVKIKVIDLRGPKARVVLQERSTLSRNIPLKTFPYEEGGVVWNDETDKSFFVRLFRGVIAKEVLARSERYISLSKSRPYV